MSAILGLSEGGQAIEPRLEHMLPFPPILGQDDILPRDDALLTIGAFMAPDGRDLVYALTVHHLLYWDASTGACVPAPVAGQEGNLSPLGLDYQTGLESTQYTSPEPHPITRHYLLVWLSRNGGAEVIDLHSGVVIYSVTTVAVFGAFIQGQAPVLHSVPGQEGMVEVVTYFDCGTLTTRAIATGEALYSIPVGRHECSLIERVDG
jgi:hypothetical protein